MLKQCSRFVLIVSFLTVLIMTAGAQVTEEWIALYNGPCNANDWAHDITVDSAGNFYFTGFCNSMAWQLSDYATVKYNPQGEQLWSAVYHGPGGGIDDAVAIDLDRAGNVYVSGYSMGRNFDYATIKYNSVGQVQWVARFNGAANGNDAGLSLVVDAQGSVCVTGYSQGRSSGEDFITLKYSSAGHLSWAARYNSPYNCLDHASFICIGNDDCLYVTGKSCGSGGNPDFLTIKYNASEIRQWEARYDGPGRAEDVAIGAAKGADGCVYVLGFSWGSGTAMDYCTIKYSSNGIQQWVARYNGPGNLNDGPQMIVLDDQENVYVTGTSDGLNPPNADYCTIKYDSSGTQVWVARHNGSRNAADSGQSLVLAPGGHVTVTGVSMELYTGADIATIKYDQVTGVEIPAPSSVASPVFHFFDPVPNPFNSSAIISYELQAASYVTLRVYNVAGSLVGTLVNGWQGPGTHEMIFDPVGASGSNQASGLYFVQMQAEDFAAVKKIMLVK